MDGKIKKAVFVCIYLMLSSVARLPAQTVETGDGKLSRADIGQLPTAAFSSLPACAPARDGKMFRVTDRNKDIYKCNGASGSWVSANGSIYFTGDFAAGSSTGGIIEAAAALPTTGGTVLFSDDITLAAAATVSLGDNKQIILDLNGHTLFLGHSSGAGLAFSGNTRGRYSLRNGYVKYIGSSSNIQGVKFASCAHFSIEDLMFTGFSFSGNVPLLVDFGEDYSINRISSINNYSTVKLVNAANQGVLNNIWAQGTSGSSVGAQIQIIDSGSITLSNILVQSQLSQSAVLIQPVTSTQGVFVFYNFYVENVGTYSATDKVINFDTSNGFGIYNISLIGCTFAHGTVSNSGGTVLGYSGSSGLRNIVSLNNSYDSFFTAPWDAAGFAPASSVTSLGDKGNIKANTVLGNPGFYGYGLSPAGASRAYDIWVGWPGFFDGSFFITDRTSGVDLLKFDTSTWKFGNGKALAGYSDNYSSQTWSIPASGAPTFSGLAVAYAAKTSTYTVTAADYTIDCTSGSFTVTLPTAVGVTGKVYVIKNSGAGTITLATTSAQTIDGSSPGTIAAGGVKRLQSTGANWISW